MVGGCPQKDAVSSRMTFVEDAMAQGMLTPILESVRGRIGNMVVKQYGSKVVLTRKPEFRNRAVPCPA